MVQKKMITTSISILLVAAVTCNAQESEEPNRVVEEDKPFLLTYPNLENSDGEVVLTNEHVVLQRLVVPSGKWEGVHSHPGNQIYVHIEGGEWSGRLGGEIEYAATMSQDGEVGWLDAVDISKGHDVGNAGDTTLELVLVTSK